MKRLLILIFLVLFGYLMYRVAQILIEQRKLGKEHFLIGKNDENLFFMDEAHWPFNKTNLSNRDSHWFLKTNIVQGDQQIDNLKETSPFQTDYYYLQDGLRTKLDLPHGPIVKPKCSKLSYPNLDLTCLGPDHPLRAKVTQYQPHIYDPDQAKIIHYYDWALYRDWRYPQRPIDLKFLAQPKDYCQKNPQVYPCYRRAQYWS